MILIWLVLSVRYIVFRWKVLLAEDPADPSKILILMYDFEKQQSVRARAGNEYADSDFRVEDFRVERIKEGGASYKVAYTTITDLRTA